jgi:hypothetical protein
MMLEAIPSLFTVRFDVAHYKGATGVVYRRAYFVNALIRAIRAQRRIDSPSLTQDTILSWLRVRADDAFVDIDDPKTVTALKDFASKKHINILIFDLNGVDHCQDGNILVMSELDARRHKSFVERRYAFDMYIGYIGHGPNRWFLRLEPLWG